MKPVFNGAAKKFVRSSVAALTALTMGVAPCHADTLSISYDHGKDTAGNPSGDMVHIYYSPASTSETGPDFYASPNGTMYQDLIGLWQPSNYNPSTGVWTDSSGYGNHLTQADATKRPALEAPSAANNNTGFVVCDGSNDYLTAAGINRTMLPKGAPYTLIIALKTDSTKPDPSTSSGYNYIAQLAQGGYNGRDIAVFQTSSATNLGTLSNITSGSLMTSDFTNGTENTKDKLGIYTEIGQSNASGSTLENFWNLNRINKVTPSVTSVNGITDTSVTYQFTLCGSNSDAVRMFLGKIGVVALYRGILSNLKMSQFISWVTNKHGLRTDPIYPTRVMTIYNSDKLASFPTSTRDACLADPSCVWNTAAQMQANCSSMGITWQSGRSCFAAPQAVRDSVIGRIEWGHGLIFARAQNQDGKISGWAACSGYPNSTSCALK